MSDRKAQLQILQKWAMHTEVVDREVNRLLDLGFNPEAPIIQAIECAMAEMTNIIGRAIAEHGDGWLSWYWLENKMGKAGLAASAGGTRRMHKIDTLAKLLDIILAAPEKTKKKSGRP